MKSLRVPRTDSIEELARFWDSHDLTDFEEELEEATTPAFERKPETVIPLHLHLGELEALRRVAQARGIEEAALLREWVLEKLHGNV